MGSKKNTKLSLHEIIRAHLGWENHELAQAFGEPRQWAYKRRNPDQLVRMGEVLKLYEVSGMTPEEFIKALRQAAAAATKLPKL
jgi:hypothetical protein